MELLWPSGLKSVLSGLFQKILCEALPQNIQCLLGRPRKPLKRMQICIFHFPMFQINFLKYNVLAFSLVFIWSQRGCSAFFIYFSFYYYYYFLLFLGPLPRHMEVPRLVVESELQPPAYARATATQDPSNVCNLHHSSQQRWILNPLNEARDGARNLMVPSQIC